MALPSAKADEPIVCRLVADSYGQKEPCIKWRPRSSGKGAFLKAATCWSSAELSMGWADPWVGLGWFELFQFLVGWFGSTTAKVLKF